MGQHYRSNTEGGPLGFLKSLYQSARWCQWVEPIDGAKGENTSVLFFRNRNGLGVAPARVPDPAAKEGVQAKRTLMVEVEDESE